MTTVRPGQAELHFHALPGIDDGPSELTESVELLAQAAADGTGTVVATPHVRSDMVTDLEDLGERVAEVQAAVDALGLGIELRRGGELGHDMVGRLSQSELELDRPGAAQRQVAVGGGPLRSAGG